MSGWYVSQDGKTTGPFSTEQVIEDVKQGKISKDAEVCATGVTRFRKITDEPELANAFSAPATPTSLPVSACASGAKCCPMPRIASVLSLVIASGLWATAAVSASRTCHANPGTIPCNAVGFGVAGLVALVSLAVAVGLAKKKPRAHCGASALHLAGLIGSGVLAKTFCPGFLVLLGLHAVGLLTTRVAKKQLCKATSPVV